MREEADRPSLGTAEQEIEGRLGGEGACGKQGKGGKAIGDERFAVKDRYGVYIQLEMRLRAGSGLVAGKWVGIGLRRPGRVGWRPVSLEKGVGRQRQYSFINDIHNGNHSCFVDQMKRRLVVCSHDRTRTGHTAMEVRK